MRDGLSRFSPFLLVSPRLSLSFSDRMGIFGLIFHGLSDALRSLHVCVPSCSHLLVTQLFHLCDHEGLDYRFVAFLLAVFDDSHSLSFGVHSLLVLSTLQFVESFC